MKNKIGNFQRNQDQIYMALRNFKTKNILKKNLRFLQLMNINL